MLPGVREGKAKEFNLLLMDSELAQTLHWRKIIQLFLTVGSLLEAE
jgi:hypothetical protein